jgi:hypothetical protein
MRTVPVELDLDMFGRGGCWALAQAVHELTGWPMRAFRRGAGPGGHVFTETPGGAFLDIRGASPRDEFLRQWGETEASVVRLQDTSGWTLPRWFSLRRWDRDACLARAREIAPGLAAAAATRDAGTRPGAGAQVTARRPVAVAARQRGTPGRASRPLPTQGR